MSGKIIAITGANGGLGNALSKRFAADGDKVVLLGRTLSKVQSVADEIGENACAIECVVADPDSVKNAFEKIASLYGKIDALINNAAVFQPSPLEASSAETIVDSISSNLIGPILCSRAAIPLLSHGGHIINVSSESVVMEFPHMVLYQAGKAGLERFSTSLNLELEPKGIRVSIVRAGQMYGPEGAISMDADAGARFYEACLARGINPLERGVSRYTATTDAFRLIVDSPADLSIGTITYRGRLPSDGKLLI